MNKAVIPASIVALVLSVIALDRLLFPLMEKQRCFWGASWVDHEKKLFKLNCMRNWASKGSPLFRSAVIQPSKERTGTRILVMGDSFVWGDGYVNINDLWWRQLSRELHSRGYNDVEVLGAGYPGYSTDNETKAAGNLMQELKPDLVIWGYTANDPDEGLVAQRGASTANSPLPWGKILPNLSLFLGRQLTAHLAPPLAPEAKKQGVQYDEPEWELQLLQGENFRRFAATVGQLATLIHGRGIKGLVVALPQSPDLAYNEARFGPVTGLFKRADVPFLDLAPSFKGWYSAVILPLLQQNPLMCGRPAAFLQVSPANRHPSAALNYFYAREVADFLEGHYKTSLGRQQKDARLTSVVINDTNPIFAFPDKVGASLQFDYPDKSYLLTMPIGRPFVQMNLERPMRLSHISISGVNLKRTSIALTTVDPHLNFDTTKVTSLPEKAGRSGDWDLAAMDEPVNTIMVSAALAKGTNHRLTLNLTPL